MTREGTKARGGTVRAGRSRDREGATVDDLRRMLVGPEQSRLERLERAVSPEVVGNMLPEAIASTRSERSEELAIALEPAVSMAVGNVARRQTHMFAEVLSPVIGSAVRKAVADAIRALMQRIDQAIDRNVSIESFRIRVEARRTGRSFAEVALVRSLLYRVEQVFLIHAETGLLLQHVSTEEVEEASSDQIASMLAAIDAFAQDAFRAQDAFAHIAQLQFGELTCLVERGASVIVASVVRGVPPADYGDILRQAQERIELENREALLDFRSDVTPFVGARPTLESCLRTERRERRRYRSAWLLAALIAALAFGLGAFLVQRARSADRFERDLDALRDTPGIFVGSAERRRGHYSIRGLRDPLAEDPSKVLERRGVRDAELRFEPYYSMDPRIVQARLVEKLDPPSGVSLRLTHGTLVARGTAPQRWIDRASAATFLAGVERIDDRDLHSVESVAATRADAEALGRIEIGFSVGSTRIGAVANRRLDEAAETAKRLLADASAARMSACIVVHGYADSTGTDEGNRSLSEGRARAVVRALTARGIAEEGVVARGEGVRGALATEAGTRARVTTFAVGLRPSVGAGRCGSS